MSEMEYNSTRDKLIIPEYGRNIQKMIRHLMQVEDRDKRTRMAYVIVDVMAQMYVQPKEAGDYRQKLWDHLHIISDFQLDVEAPYPKPDPDKLHKKPEPIKYATGGIRYSHYGKHIQAIIEKVAELEEGSDKEVLTRVIANHLKKSYLNWNRDSVNDELILKHLEELSKGRIKWNENMRLMATNDILARTAQPASHTKDSGGKKKKFGRQQNGSYGSPGRKKNYRT